MFEFVSGYPMIAMSIVMLLCAGAYHAYQFRLRPLLIPKHVIETLATEFRCDHGTEAADVVSNLIDRAQFRGDPFEQGRLKRVLKHILVNSSST